MSVKGLPPTRRKEELKGGLVFYSPIAAFANAARTAYRAENIDMIAKHCFLDFSSLSPAPRFSALTIWPHPFYGQVGPLEPRSIHIAREPPSDDLLLDDKAN